MADIQDFAEGANILQQVDVSEIFKSLAMGIAEAQQKLDDNSIAQIRRLTDAEVGGKSLLELGFVPAFYSFTYADISASINLKMAMKSSWELGVAASFDFASGSASEADFADLSKENQFHTEKGEFKSNRKFSMKSSSSKSIKVNNQYYHFDETTKNISKIEKLHEELLQDESIDSVNYELSSAFTTVYQTVDTFSILKITSYTGNSFTTPSITIAVSFSNAFASLPTGEYYGFSGSDLYGLAPTSMKTEFFFDTGKFAIDFGYDQNVPGHGNIDKTPAFDALANILRSDTSLTINIEGYTDSFGGPNSNNNLSTNRCENMRKWFVSKGVSASQINIAPKGESLALSNNGPDNDPNVEFRKVSIILPAGKDYIFFTIPVTPTPMASGDINVFIAVPTAKLVVTNGNASDFVLLNYETESTNSAHFLIEEREDIFYFLHKETEVTFMAYSTNSDTINIAAEEGSTEEIKVYQNENSKERIKNLATKNNSNKTFAASASIDFRMSRQFEMSMEGSASMSARLVAVPPPDQFKTHISTIFNA